MSATLVRLGPALAVAVVLLTGTASLVALRAGLGTSRAALTAALRAVVQLAAVSSLIVVVIPSVPASIGFVALMATVASATSARRLAASGSWWIAAPVALPAVGVVVLLLLTGVVPVRGVAIVPVSGILLGGGMTATTLAGRRVLEELTARRGEYEAGLAIGLLERDAVLEVCRPAAASALVPGLDQTRTVGLVTLPGAFVGLLLAGAPPWQAGAAQLLVLVSLLAVQACAVAAVLELVARGVVRRDLDRPAGAGRRPRWRAGRRE